jgi:hypothetical protein
MSNRLDKVAVEYARRDSIESELSSIKGLIETAQAAVTNPDASRQAIYSTLEVAMSSVDRVKTLCFGPTPT